MSRSGSQGGTDYSAWVQAGQGMVSSMLEFFNRQAEQLNQAGIKLPPIDALGAEAGALGQLQQAFAEQHLQLWSGMLARQPDQAYEPVLPANADRRFASAAWTQSPIYDYLRQAYLINAKYLADVAEALPVADRQARNRLQFMTRQYIDALSPANFAATNPEFVQCALDTQGESITRGLMNLLADMEKGRISMSDDTAFEVGRNLATTPGAVIFENELFQLIQYSAQTAEVYQRPLLMVPPCINKYYILDLQVENSFVRYAVEQGVSVFLMSWRNPGQAQAALSWDDYIEHGVLRALSVVADFCPKQKPNVLGFCVGGTLAACALAVAAARGELPAQSLTLLTTLLDFADPGELGCFVDEASVATREATIGKAGLLAARELASVFSLLRPNDLVWNYVVDNYLKGKAPTAFDLLYWNADSTNLPGPFAAWYLRNMYLENNLRLPDRLSVGGTPVNLGRIDCPSYFLSTREDHIVPWRSSYLGRRLLGGPSTFVLGASGHIAGVINPAAKQRRSYWSCDSDVASAEEWLAAAQEYKGSWWPHWIAWLADYSGPRVAAPQKLGKPRYRVIEPAPGRYVKERA